MANVLIVDDDDAVADAYGAFCARVGHAVTRAATGAEAVARYEASRPDLVLLDLRLPDMTGFDVYDRIRADGPVVVMITGHGDVPMAVRAMREGVENFLTKPVELTHLAVVIDRALEKARLRRLSQYVSSRRAASGAATIGTSARMLEIASQLELLARAERTTVLIFGERGTGKGRAAEMLHAQSPRAERPFVEVNCAAQSAEALDAELFGVEAVGGMGGGGEPVSGNAGSPGLIEVATGGTLFLDEIADLPAVLQPKLLRVLEGRSFRRAGGRREVMADVRVVAATHRDLIAEVDAGRFREDLYYRLSVMPLTLPPLRARAPEDLTELIGHVMQELSRQLASAPRGISEEAVGRLLRHPWTGNIRELRNVLERAMIVADGAERIEAIHLPPELRPSLPVEPGDVFEARPMADVERQHIEGTLRACGGNRTHAAKALGISRATLIKKIKDFGLAKATR